MTAFDSLAEALFAASPAVRYVALGRGAYRNFFQLVMPVAGGHVSVAIDRTAVPTELVGLVREALASAGLGAPG